VSASKRRITGDGSGATLLHIHLHTFERGWRHFRRGGAGRKHISVHTWPEKGYAALMCSCAATPSPARRWMCSKRAFNPGRIVVANTSAASFRRLTPEINVHAEGGAN